MNNIFLKVYNLIDRMCQIVDDTLFPGDDLGDVVVTIQQKKKSIGFFSYRENWDVDGIPAREIGITPFCLSKGPEAIFISIIHQMIHLYVMSVKKDKVKYGDFHYGLFREICVKKKIHFIYNPHTGGITPYENLPPETLSVIQGLMDQLTPEELELSRNIRFVEKSMAEKKAADKNLFIYICPECKQVIRACNNCNLVCGECSKTMLKMGKRSESINLNIDRPMNKG